MGEGGGEVVKTLGQCQIIVLLSKALLGINSMTTTGQKVGFYSDAYGLQGSSWTTYARPPPGTDMYMPIIYQECIRTGG